MIIIVSGLHDQEIKAYIQRNKADGLKEVKTYFPEADYWRVTRITAIKESSLVIRQNWVEYTFNFKRLEEVLHQQLASCNKVEIKLVGFSSYFANRVG